MVSDFCLFPRPLLYLTQLPAMSQIWRDQVMGRGPTGIARLWLGLGPTLWRDIPFSMLYWTAIEHTRFYLKKTRADLNPLFVNFLAGATAGLVSAYVTTPLDVIKTRVQMTLDTSHVRSLSFEKFTFNSSIDPSGEHVAYCSRNLRRRGLATLLPRRSAPLITSRPSCCHHD